MKAIEISVFRSKAYRGCSNGGITEKYDYLLLVCEEGYIDIDENDLPENLVIYEERFLGGKTCGYIRPYAHQASGRTPYMFGGAYAASSDSRFSRTTGQYAAIPVHDRTETWEEYEILSR